MKFLRLLIISFLAFTLIATGFSLFFPSSVRVSRAVNLGGGADSVLGLINDFAKWKQWYPGFSQVTLSNAQMDGNKVVAATVGGVSLQRLISNDSLVQVRLKKGAKPVLTSWKLIRHVGTDSLTLQNYMDFSFKWYPWEKFSSLLLERSYGAIMEQGLHNLKLEAAKLP